MNERSLRSPDFGGPKRQLKWRTWRESLDAVQYAGDAPLGSRSTPLAADPSDSLWVSSIIALPEKGEVAPVDLVSLWPIKNPCRTGQVSRHIARTLCVPVPGQDARCSL